MKTNRNINFDNFRNRIKTAIKHEKEFCENINELKNKLGSNDVWNTLFYNFNIYELKNRIIKN